MLVMVLVSAQFQILYYLPVMWCSIEYLNRQPRFLQQFNAGIINFVFAAYVFFICIDRGRPFQFNDTIELIINSIEHVLFGLIICMKAAIYLSIFSNKPLLSKPELISIAVIFNIFGFLNEFFQNWYKHQPLLQLNFDSRKDILMNIIGSVLLIILYARINHRIQNQWSAK